MDPFSCYEHCIWSWLWKCNRWISCLCSYKRGSVRFILKSLNFRSSICFITCRNNWFSIWGLSIALGALGDVYLKEASALGINPEVLHRIAAIACGGLDTLPHNGAVITLLGVTGMTHKESYLDIGMCTAIIPILAVIVCIILGSMGIV